MDERINGDPIRQIADLFTVVEQASAQLGENPWFRGHARADWQLVPWVYRDYGQLSERNAAKWFRLRAPSRYAPCPAHDDVAGWLTLMRHYGLPTRLLDWSGSILVAAFFAVLYGSPVGDAAIWALGPAVLNERLTHKDGVYPLSGGHALEAVQEAFVDSRARKQVVAAVPAEIDMRVTVQQARFTVHCSPDPLEEFDDAPDFLRKHVIPEDVRAEIAEKLQQCGITLSNMFPDLEHLAEELAFGESGRHPARRAPS